VKSAHSRPIRIYSRDTERRATIAKHRKRLNAVTEGMIDLTEPFKRRGSAAWRRARFRCWSGG
jgi:hypothetical protein